MRKIPAYENRTPRMGSLLDADEAQSVEIKPDEWMARVHLKDRLRCRGDLRLRILPINKRQKTATPVGRSALQSLVALTTISKPVTAPADTPPAQRAERVGLQRPRTLRGLE
jgi:hypothetical protein